MRISWRERLNAQPSLREFAKWPFIPAERLPKKLRKPFLRNQEIIAQVLDHQPLGEVAERYDLTPGRISQLLDRCLGGEANTAPLLTEALIPYRNLVERKRQSVLPTAGQPGGHACAFKALLDTVPGLREALDAMIEAKLADKPYAQRVSPIAFFGEFKRVLKENHWPRDQYPYTTASTASTSVWRYLQQRTTELVQARQQKRTKKQYRNLGIKLGIKRALRATQIDGHLLNLQGKANLLLNDELIPLRLGRATVLVPIDVDTSCVLGFHLAPTRHPNQDDFLTLIDHILQPWEPLELATPGLSYAPGACFPSGLPDAFPISFGTVHLDNALIHKAHSVVDLLCDKMSATRGLGLPAQPLVRQLVESVFDYISDHFSNRVASTTGAHPTDPAKESRKNRKKPPIITYQTIIEALSVILTEYNITPRADLGFASPLELYQHHYREHFVRYVPPSVVREWQPFISSKDVALHWYRHEQRLPTVNFAHLRYQGPGLLQAVGKHRQIRIVFDRRDVRSVHAYTLDGEDLGVIFAPKSWQRFPHTLATRNWICRHAKEYRLNMRDPLSSHFRWLLEHKGKTSVALSLLSVYTEYTGDGATSLQLGPATDTHPTTGHPETGERHSSKRYVWHPDTASHRN